MALKLFDIIPQKFRLQKGGGIGSWGGILRGGMNRIPVCSRSSRKENTCKSNMTTKTVSADNRNGNHASRHDWSRLECPTFVCRFIRRM